MSTRTNGVVVDVTKLPILYRCLDCGAEGVKLWRLYQVFVVGQQLRCRACAVKQARAEGFLANDGGDQIGSMVPAVPTEDGTFWGYTSVPDAAVVWWKVLPEVDSRRSSKPELGPPSAKAP